MRGCSGQWVMLCKKKKKTVEGPNHILNQAPYPLEMLEGSNKTLCAPGPRDPKETEPDLRLSVWVSPVEVQAISGLPQGQRLCVQQTCLTQLVPYALLEEVTIKPPQSYWADDPQTTELLYQINSHTVKKVLGPTADFPTWGSGKWTESPQVIWLWRPVGFDYRTYTGLGKQTLGGLKQNLVHTGTQQKGAVTPQETDPDLPVSVQESPVEVWVSSGLVQGWGQWEQQCLHWTFERGHHYLHYLHHSFCLRSNNRTGTQPCPSTENWIKDLLSMGPSIRIRPSFPP